MLALSSIVAGGWVHFITFKQASDDSFGQATPERAHARALVAVAGSAQASQVQQAARGAKHVQTARKHLGRNVLVNLVIINIIFVIFALLSSLWPANVLSPGDYQVLSSPFSFCARPVPLIFNVTLICF